jgi:hypothetical protein
MRGILSSLAAVLSLLMVSTSVSASACDLSCWLRQTHSDCHTVGPAAASKDDMPMPAGADMDSGPAESSMAPDSTVSATPAHSMPMAPQQEMAAERFVHGTRPDMRTSAMPEHSRSVSSCTHETCSQISASASPPGADHAQLDSLHWMAVSISSPVNLLTGFHWIHLGTPPPTLLSADRLITALRI